MVYINKYVTIGPFIGCTCGLQCHGFTDCKCGPQWADVDCLGNRMLSQVHTTMVAAQAVTRGEAVSLSLGAQQSGTIVI